MKTKLFWALTIGVIIITGVTAQAGTYTSDFSQYLADNQSKDMISAIITMSDRVDIEALKKELSERKANRQQWHETVVKALQEKATEAQADVLAELDKMEMNGQISSYRNLWVGNLIIVTASRDALDNLVQRFDVDQIAPDYEIELDEYTVEEGGTPMITAGTEDGIRQIRADEVFAMGYTGAGRLVSHIDTGVDGSHPALRDRWRGNDDRYVDNPEWAWFDPVTETDFPFDEISHGTHTMGTMCGLAPSNLDTDTIGVAIGAEWISAGVIDRVDVENTIADALLAFQWIADPDGDPSTVWDVPDVCSNSWGVTDEHGYEPCDETFWETIDAVEAAGVVVVYSAGNEGPTAGSIKRPADRATTDVSTFSVGAVNGVFEYLPICDFSSRGPSYCTADGSEAIKPEVVAPGNLVLSCIPGAGYWTYSGTSMAVPHIAGTIALMREANPDLPSDRVKQILLETARDLGVEGEDNTYGVGVIDAYEAVTMALAYNNGWGVVSGTIKDQVTGDLIYRATVSVIDREWSAVTDPNGVFYLMIPADTVFDIRVDHSPEHMPAFDQVSVSEDDTTMVDYTLETKVEATFTAEFGNGTDVSYRAFYIRGSWDDDGFYDESWSGDFISMTDDGESPDETANDGIFTGQAFLGKDLENTYNWAIYTENYGVNSLDDSYLASGEDFTIEDLNSIVVPVIEPNPTGSDDDFAFSVESDNDLSLDLVSGYDGEADYIWGNTVELSTGVEYNFRFYTMHAESPYYGIDGVGGDAISYTPEVDGEHEIIFDDEEDFYVIQPTGGEGIPVGVGATSGLDGHIPVYWAAPGTMISSELAYDDGTAVNGWSFVSPSNYIAVMFVPESYPVSIDSVMVHVITEGDSGWPEYDNEHDPIGVSIFLDDGSGNPATDPAFYTEVAAEVGEWIKVDIDQISVSSGYFWVATNKLAYEGFDLIGLDIETNYPANQWYYGGEEWYSGGAYIYDGDNMIRAKVFNDEVSSWMCYDNAMPAEKISVPVIANFDSDMTVSTTSATNNLTTMMTDPVNLPELMAYHPRILTTPDVIAETETVLGYNLYRGTTSNPYYQGLKVNSSYLTETRFNDYGDDSYGPIVNDVTYYYQVSAVYYIDGTGVEVGPSEEVTGIATNVPPEAPVNLTGSNDGYAITLNWDANTDYDIVAYNVYRRSYNEDEFTIVETVNHPTTTFSEQLVDANLYYYKLTAIDIDGAESYDYSNMIELFIGSIPPSYVTASTDQEFGITLEWKSPASHGLTTDYEALKLAILHADVEGMESEIIDYLLETGEVSSYTYFDVRNSTPSLSDIESYDVVFVWSNYQFDDNDALGDMLADYVDLGKGVVTFAFCYGNSGFSLQGRFMDEYSPIGSGNNIRETTVLDEYNEFSHLMEGVTELTDYHSADVDILNNADIVAYWDNGYPAVATSTVHSNIVCINGYIGTNDRQWTGDMLRLVRNAMLYVTGDSGLNPDGYNLYKSDSEEGPFELIDSFDGIIRGYEDAPVANGIPYYYQVTAFWNEEESVPVTVSGMGQNYAPEAPIGLLAMTNDYRVELSWEFTNLMGDFSNYNIYRKLYGESEWNLIGTSNSPDYMDEIAEGADGIYQYSVSAVDNGDPQLESELSDMFQVEIGDILPPQDLVATSNQDNVVPLSWSAPGLSTTSMLAYDDGVASFGVYFNDTATMIARQFTGIAPIEIHSVSVRILTEGDETWPWPNRTHDPVTVSIWDDDGTGQPGSVIAEATLTCQAGEWLTVDFRTPITCDTDNFWVSWKNTTGYDALAYDDVCNYPEQGWYFTDGAWHNEKLYDGDMMIRAAIDNDSVNESLADSDLESISIEGIKSENSNPVVCNTEEMLGYYIYRSTSEDVPIDDDYRITSDYVTDTYYDDEDVTNGTTYYYIAVAVYDDDGEVAYSIASNEISATPMDPGQFAADPLYIESEIELGEGEVSIPITLTNDGGLPVTYNASAIVSDSEISAASNVNYGVSSEYTVVNVEVDKSSSRPDDLDSPVVTDNGGPDNYGYSWIDSNDEDGPEFYWIDIGSVGELFNIGDESSIGPISMGFDFPFYGNNYSSIRICDNGYISFTSSEIASENQELPCNSEPYNLIAPFWTDFYPEIGGEIYYYSSSDSTVISFMEFMDYSYGMIYTFQIILTSYGSITFQYYYVDDMLQIPATIGIQNADGSDGLGIGYNDGYAESEMAVQINTPWLSVYPISGTIEAGGSATVDAIIKSDLLEVGDYNGMIYFSAADMNHDLDLVEVSLDIEVYEDTTGIDYDSDALPTVFSMDQNYPNPFNATTEIRYALASDSDVKLEVYNVLGQKVVTLIDQKQVAGYHSLVWNGTNDSGQVVSSGIYLYRLSANDKTFLKKMILLK